MTSSQPDDEREKAKARTVVLRDEREGRDVRHLEMVLDEAGDLVIRGWDLGPGVEGFWGQGLGSYKWQTIVRGGDVRRVIELFSGAGGRRDDVLGFFEDVYHGEAEGQLERWLKEREIPSEFSNWITE